MLYPTIVALLAVQLALLTTIDGAQASIFGFGAKKQEAGAGKPAAGRRIALRMPDIRPDHAEQYLCMTVRVRPDPAGEFIVGFNPAGEAGRVHHMLLYGCEMPGIFQRDSPRFVWDCSQMHAGPGGQAEEDVSFERAPVCRGHQQILYGWALDAPALKLPADVGFKIGGPNSQVDFLVLQVHYGHYHAFAQLPELTDNSGLILDVKPNAESSGIKRQAGVLILISLGYVPEGVSKHEIWCEIKDNIEIHPFRFRVHTHKLGTKVIGAKIGKEQRNTLGYNFNEGSIIGVGDPQKPQTFYPVRDTNLTLSRGDSVYAACEFNNDRPHDVKIGQTGDDEMCNFYMMYWTDSPNLLTASNCYGQNPEPSYYRLLSNLGLT